MADYSNIKERVQQVIRPNGTGAITAADHQELLLEIVGEIEKNENELVGQYDHKAEPDGNYPQMTAGFAGNLVGRGEAVDATIGFRASGGGQSIQDGAARVKELLGNTIVVDGELLSCNADGIKSVGFNAWDEQWEQGYITTDGHNGTSGSEIRSKNYIRVLPNTAYYFPYYLASKYGASGSLYMVVYFYDSAKQLINSSTTYLNWGEASWIMTTPSNCHYMRFFTPIGNGKYNGDICINLSHSGYRNGEYQPYVQFIRNLDPRIREAFPYGLRSAGAAADKVYNKNGKGYIERRIVAVDLASYNWTYGEYLGENYYYATDSNVTAEAICGKYNHDKVHNNVVDMDDKSFIVASNQLYIKDTDYTNEWEFTAGNEGVMFFYALAEPEVIEYDEPFNLDYEVWDFGTEQMLASRPSAPIKAKIAYGFNAVDSVRNAQLEIAELKTQIATMQAMMASLAAHNE